jgi:glycine dehydrogenase subunit 2
MIVEEAMMIEPTETESKETLDRFVEILSAIDREAAETPQKVLDAPHTTPVARIDEVRAARQPDLRYRQARPAQAGAASSASASRVSEQPSGV